MRCKLVWALNTRRATGIISLALSYGALAGCASFGPPGASSPSRSKLAQAQTTHEYPSSTPARESATGGAPTAIGAIRAFASEYINWTAPSVAANMRALASGSVGQARSATALAAAQTAQDYELQRGGVANSGTVQAVAPLSGSSDRYAVVTRELTTAVNTSVYQGLRPAWHLAIATVVQLTPGRWVLSGWQPEN